MIFFDICPLKAKEFEPLLFKKARVGDCGGDSDEDDNDSQTTADSSSVAQEESPCCIRPKSAMRKPKATPSQKRVNFNLMANQCHHDQHEQPTPEEKSTLWYNANDLFAFRLLAAQKASELLLDNLRWKLVLDRIFETSRTATPAEPENPLAYYRPVLTTIYQDIDELMGLEHHFLPQSLQEAEVRRSAILQCLERTDAAIRDSCMERLCLPSRLFSHELAAAQHRSLVSEENASAMPGDRAV